MKGRVKGRANWSREGFSGKKLFLVLSKICPQERQKKIIYFVPKVVAKHSARRGYGLDHVMQKLCNIYMQMVP